MAGAFLTKLGQHAMVGLGGYEIGKLSDHGSDEKINSKINEEINSVKDNLEKITQLVVKENEADNTQEKIIIISVTIILLAVAYKLFSEGRKAITRSIERSNTVRERAARNI